MNKNSEIYDYFFSQAKPYDKYPDYEDDNDAKLLPFLKLIDKYDVQQIAKDIVNQIKKNLPDLASYARFDLQCIHFEHDNYVQTCGNSGMELVTKGIKFSEDLLSGEVIYRDYKCIEEFSRYEAVFGFDYSISFYRYIQEAFRTQTYDDHFNSSISDLVYLIEDKGYLGLHLALKEIIPPLNFPKNLPFVIGEHDRGWVKTVYINE